MKPLPEDLQLIGPEELAALLGRTIKSVQVLANARPDLLPPRFRPIRSQRSAMRWRIRDVRMWMDKLSLESFEQHEAERAARAKMMSHRPWRS